MIWPSHLPYPIPHFSYPTEIKDHSTKNNSGPQPGMEFEIKCAIRGSDEEPRHRRPCSYRVRVADAMIKVAGRYQSAGMPPVTFTYAEFRPQEQRYQSLVAQGNDLPPQALNNPNVALVDLFGDGLPAVVHSGLAGFRYWRNLGGGRLDRPRSADRKFKALFTPPLRPRPPQHAPPLAPPHPGRWTGTACGGGQAPPACCGGACGKPCGRAIRCTDKPKERWPGVPPFARRPNRVFAKQRDREEVLYEKIRHSLVQQFHRRKSSLVHGRASAR
jgi:hypothetical protein